MSLAASVPNPLRTSAVVPFELADPGLADLVVFDVTGRRVKVLLHRLLPAGRHETVWDGTDDQGNRVQGGVYFTRLATAEGERSRSLLVVR
jgi:flagellar hook assembly protein FlgD